MAAKGVANQISLFPPTSCKNGCVFSPHICPQHVHRLTNHSYTSNMCTSSPMMKFHFFLVCVGTYVTVVYNGFRLRLGVWDSWKCRIPYLSHKGRLCDYFLRGRANTSHKEIAWYVYCPSNRRLLVPDISFFNGRIVCHFL